MVADHVGDRPTLLVLDNCEHMIAESASFVDEAVGDNGLWLGLEKAGSWCVEYGLLDDVATDIASGRRAEQSPVLRPIV